MVKKNHTTVPYASNKAIRHSANLRLLLMNAQSIRNKDDILSEYMRGETIDTAIATESWLTNSVRDVIWLKSNELVKDGYQISVRNREGKRGGGLALIYGSNIIATELTQRKQRSFKVTYWMTTIGNSTLNIQGIYHPPYSVGQNITNAMFLDYLTGFRTDWMASYRNVIICGDFNMHIDNPSDMEAQILFDTMEALGLQQHLSFQTHQAGKILDLIFMEATGQFSIRTFKGRFISDHRAIVE